MYGPYKMVFISCTAFLILLITIIVYKYIYPKKKINYLALIILVSILPIISILRPGDYESGDFNIHVYRAMDFYNSLKDGILIPSWAGTLNATYGYPLFIFLNPLPYYLVAFFHFLGISFIDSMKLLLALGYVFSGVFFYLFAKREVKNSFAAFSGAIIYQFAPYHFVDLHFRNDIGEVLVFTFLPLFFYFFSKLIEKKNLFWFISTSIAYSLMMFSHQAIAVFALIIIIPYVFYSTLKEKRFLNNLSLYISSIGMGFLYSIYIWITHITYTKYTLAYQITGGVGFPSLQEVLFSSWRYGLLFQGPNGEISHAIGYTQIIILISALFILLGKYVKKPIFNPFMLWFGLCCFILFMISPFSDLIWRTVPIISTAQFSFRLLIDLIFCIAILMIYFSILLKKHQFLIIIFLFITIGYTILNWGHRRVIPVITDASLIANLPKSTFEGEGFCCIGQPKWTLSAIPDDRWMKNAPNRHIEIIEGNGEIKNLQRNTTNHEYISFSNESIKVKENTWYFPGWNLLIDNKPTKIELTKGNDPGIMLFTIPPGPHKISLTYADLPLLFAAKIVSFSTFIGSLLMLTFMFLNKNIRDRFNKRFKNLFIH